VLFLSACYPQVPTDAVQEIENGKEVLSQTLQWSSCDGGFECASLVVPLNWLEQGRDYFEMALIRPAGSGSLPPLVINPGGPGASGVSFVRDNLESIGTANLRNSFQIIGFDPRGVGESEPVTCNDVDLKDQVFYGQSPYTFGSDADLEWSRGIYEEFAKDCQLVGFDLGYFNTQQTARDMDLIRQALGLETLDYLGYSYGTELGATYAALFPNRVGKFVLDGAADPNISAGQTLLNQVAGFDQAFRNYLVDCLAGSDCPFSGPVNSALAEVKGFLTKLESSTLPTQFDREVGVTAAIYGIIAALYSEQSWSYLTQALTEALNGDGTTLLMLADFYNDRDPDGGYTSNINEANIAISCADSRVSEAEAEVLRPQIAAASEVFGRYFAYPELSCVGWPEGKGQVAVDYEIPLANSPLVVGTTGDPATPYGQAVSMSKLLDGARLLTFEGEGHTAYGGNDCVNDYVESYLLGKPLPEADMRCY
jgi:pimeloyl-ACP methyl ester carboxylesterase